jgi:acetyl esterase/lipase
MLRRILSLATVLLSACTSHQGRPMVAKPIATPIQLEVEVVRNVTYSPAHWPEALAADVYVPSGSGPFPGVLMIHGGGWEGRTRADMDDIALAVAKRGYVVMNASYRFAPGAHFPAQLHDMQQALLWLRANRTQYRVQPGRIAAWGYSAGAHLAALLGTTGPGDRQFVEGTRVQAVVAGGTPVDLRFYPDGRLTTGLMGVGFTTDPDLWRDASPIALVSTDDPPTFLYHGTFDVTVGVRNAHEMYAALNAARVPAELYLVRGLEHITTFLIDWPIPKGIDFLDRTLRQD